VVKQVSKRQLSSCAMHLHSLAQQQPTAIACRVVSSLHNDMSCFSHTTVAATAAVLHMYGLRGKERAT
jgi:hypothetical protein